MADYQLTRRGKIVLGILILVLMLNIGYSGKVLLNQIASNESQNASTPTSSSEPISETPTEVPTETLPERPTETPTETSTETPTQTSIIYTVEILEDLRASLFEFYFDQGTVEYREDYGKRFQDLLEVMQAYPSEEIVVEGHVNGYPTFAQTQANIELSKMRSAQVVERLIEEGLESDRITVYNFGSEVPKVRQSASQDENDRVIVYFKDHYNFGDFGK